MKQLKTMLVSALILGATQANAQCSDAKNNFEMKLVPGVNKTLNVQIRYNNGSVDGAVSTLPTTQSNLFGLVYAISWPTTSQVKIESVNATAKPFSIAIDEAASMPQNKNVSDNIVTFYHNNDMPAAFNANWRNGEWMTIAEVKYSGSLNGNDFFSFVNCDYGMSHPNSYSGNSHTDPWFALLDPKTGAFEQYSPKMMTEVPGTVTNVSNFNIYPNPTSDVFNVEISTDINTQVAINITDLNGRVVSNQIVTVAKGLNKASVNASALASGNYLIKITDGKTLNYIQKVQKN
jgi:hypothetical protein